jgi:hypothetical protein
MSNDRFKFRAWDKTEKEMIYGWTDLEMDDFFRKHYELMQWTGLTDSRGKDVYEGDIVNVSYYATTLGEVIFYNGAYRLKDTLTDVHYPFILTPPYPPNYWCEILGHVFENHELLKCPQEPS